MPRLQSLLAAGAYPVWFHCRFNGVMAGTARTHIVRLALLIVWLLFQTEVAHAGIVALELADGMHSMSARLLSWSVVSMLSPHVPVDSLAAYRDTLRLRSGDPTNTDLPKFFPSTSATRLRLSPAQYRSKYPKDPSGYLIASDIDSALQAIRLRELFEGSTIGLALPLSVETYLAARRELIAKEILDSTVSAYSLKKATSDGELEKLLQQATNISIPLPPSPLFGIFGKPEIAINVNGEVNVQAGWRWDTQRLGTASVLGQTQSAPIFNQNIQVNVSGRIGDKLRMNVDWNTLNQFEFNNRFKIGFEGYDDDIIKRVEFGNVNLETPSTLIGGGQTLFGIRSDYQFGPLFLKTILSQRRGERRFLNARGGSSKTYFTVRAYDYARNHFFLDTSYFRVWKEYFRSATPVLPSNANDVVIKEIEVWESTNDVRDVQATEAVAFDTLGPVRFAQGERYDASYRNRKIQVGSTESGRFMRLEPKRYDVDLNLGTITILNMRTERTYAVSYRTEGPSPDASDDLYHGTLSTNVGITDTLVLKLIYRQNMQPGFRTIWRRQMRNRFNIGMTNVSQNDAKIGLWYFRNTNDSTDVLQGAPDKIATILRIDQVNNGTGAAPPDGAFDARPPVFNAQRGEITFPSLEPFREGFREYFASKGNPELAEQYVYNEVYDTTDQAARLITAKDRFVIVGEASGQASGTRIPLNFNVAPNSVRVSLDGVPLREGSDYTVDYYTGTLNLLNPRATLPNANLNVEYEQNDIFNLTTRTLAGVRADLQLLNRRRTKTALGMTFMNFDQAAIIDRVTPGQEPNANMMLGFDMKIDAELPWLTRALDALPLFDTKEKSTFAASGEWAMVAPTPNKRISTICSDNGKSVAYVDDFESARRSISFGLTPGTWSHSSPSVDPTLWPDDASAMKYRAQTFWYQKFVPDIPQADVYPNRARIIGRSNINPIRIAFDPRVRGIYNTNPEFIDRNNPRWNDPDSLAVRQQATGYMEEHRPQVWGGMMRLLSQFNTNFDNDNIDYIEVMMRIDAAEPGSRMFIDLGQISEDVIPDQRLSTEDRSPPNNLIDEGEDIGLDSLSNERERVVYPDPLNREADPARDDYFFDFGADRASQSENDFIKYNNFEGNASQSENGQFPNTEILNRNNGQTIMLDNSYFRYEIRLDANPATNPQIVGGNPEKGWFLYRIPVRRPDTVVGNPLFTNIQYVRIHFQGGVVRLNVADWGLVGTFWLRSHNFQPGVTPSDSVLQVAYVSREENSSAPDFYTMPPCVTPPRQLSNPDPNQDIFFNEQSLVVKVNNLRYGEERMSVRLFRQQDMFFYREMAFFIHGDATMPDRVTTGATPPAMAFVRFGVDSANYYEYRRPLLRGWQDLRIMLNDITATKQLRDQTRINDRQVFPVPNDPDAQFAIKGSPILTRVQFVAFGVSNPAERFPNELSTTMWVNELRLVDAVDDVDWAAVGQATLKLADLAEVTSSVRQAEPNFHRLEERFGDRKSRGDWNVQVTAGMEKLLPKEMRETKIPLMYSHAETVEDPLFQAQNDVELERAARAAQADTLRKGASPEIAQAVYDDVRIRSQTVRVQDQFALTGLRLGIPTKLWYINDIFNKLTFNYSYAQEFERSQVVQQKFRWQWNFRVDYALTLPSKFSVKPTTFLDGVPGLKAYKDLRVNFMPSNLALSLNMRRGRITEQSRFLDFPSPIIREFVSEQMGSFTWKLTEGGFLSPVLDYKVMSANTLVPLEFDIDGRQRDGQTIVDQMFGGDGRLLNFGQTNNLTQTVTVTMRPRLPEILGLTRLLETTSSYNVTYTWFDPLQPDATQRDIVKNARYNSQFRLSPVLRWRQVGNEIFGQPKKGEKTFLEAVGATVQEIFFGFENLTTVLSQTNQATNPGVQGGTGVTNLWGRTMAFRGGDPIWGPSTAYQLGLVRNPHGSIGVEGSPRFPFFRFTGDVGVRPPNGVMQDDYNQKTTIQVQTSRPLWPGATLDLSMKSDFGFTRNQRVVTDAAGIPTFTNITQRQTLERSFISLPDFLTFGLAGDNVANVIELYNQRRGPIEAIPDTSRRNQLLLEALANSFREGFESMQLWSGELARVMPALNWTLRWEGIEKLPMFKGVAQRIFLEHGYASTYTENARINDNGRIIEVQQVQVGFRPLVGITANFDEKALDGVLTASLRYNSTTGHSLNAAARSAISLEQSHELQIQASYLRRGVTMKFLGFDTENDLELSFLAQYKKSLQSRYDVANFDPNAAVVQGTTQITIEPRARYTVSSRVTASAFARYDGNFNEGATSPGYSTMQVGVDIRISISGGR